VTPTDRLYFRVHESSIRGTKVVAFLRHLLRHVRRRPIVVFWDGGPHHRANVVRSSLAIQPRLELHRFSGYSPELIPDDWVWNHLKEHEPASYAPHDVRELRRGVRLSVL
jgi:putative transposase